MNDEEEGVLVWVRKMAAELIGTIVLVFAAAMTGSNVLEGSLGSGLTVAVLVACLGGISGCHINPMVSIGFIVSSSSSTKALQKAITTALAYIPCHVVGSVIGALLCYVTSSSALYASITGGRHVLDINAMNGQINNGPNATFMYIIPGLKGIVLEVVIGFQLMATILLAGDSAVKPFYIGLSVVMGILVGGRASGGSMNPTRSFGPEFIGFVFNDLGKPAFAYHYVYWIGPILGSILAAVVYKALFAPPGERWFNRHHPVPKRMT